MDKAKINQMKAVIIPHELLVKKTELYARYVQY